MNDYSGDWQTSFGPMHLSQRGRKVRGTYAMMGAECLIEGEAVNGKLSFRYREPTVEGEGWFELGRRGRAFHGLFHEEGSERWHPWEGDRVGFDGLWNTSFGLMRLVEDGDRVEGFYEMGGGAKVAGRRDGNRLTFTYREPDARGRGRFVLADDGLSFQGQWRVKGETAWRPWTGIRVRPQPDVTWLIVIEAPWQRFLSERDYSFGSMLREFFARVPHVQVRHRFFTNEAGLRRSCRDLLYIAEPVVLVVATHAKPEGITVDGQTVDVRVLIDGLRPAGNLRLLHFSACLLMQAPEMVQVLRDFGSAARLPISGYRTSVDWAESAIIEFTYLDLVLSRGMTPANAAELLPKLLPFAGDGALPEGPFAPAGFTLVAPGPKNKRA